jgi:uncharacterized protein YjiS (DUF1127 family)
MSNPAVNSIGSTRNFGDGGIGRIGSVCKQILNDLAELSRRPAQRQRLAALSPRLLEDIGMTIAERDDLLR